MQHYEYEVDLRFGELLKFQIYMIVFRMKLGVFIGLWVLVGLYMVSQIVTGQVSLSDSTTGLLITIGLPSFVVAATVIGTYRSFRQAWKPKLPIRYSVGADGITTSMPSVSSAIEWGGVEEAKSWGGLFLLFLNRHCALIIPTRCIGEQLAEFQRDVRERLRRAV